MSEIPFISGKIKTDLDKLSKIVTIFCLMKDIKIRPFERDVLIYYLKYGFSEETKTIISEDTGRDVKYIHTTNTHLRDLGFLNKDKYNRNKTELSPAMEFLRTEFVEKQNNGVFVGFEK